jgi:hypothetical protein
MVEENDEIEKTFGFFIRESLFGLVSWSTATPRASDPLYIELNLGVNCYSLQQFLILWRLLLRAVMATHQVFSTPFSSFFFWLWL